MVKDVACMSIFCGEVWFFSEKGNPKYCSFMGIVPGQVSCLRSKMFPGEHC